MRPASADGTIGSRLDQKELAEGLRPEGSLVDVRDDLAPLIDDLRGVVAAADFRHLKHHRRFVVHREPRLEVGDVEIRVDEIGGAEWVVLDRVVGGSGLLEIDVLLTDDEGAAEQIDVGLGDRLLVKRLRRRPAEHGCAHVITSMSGNRHVLSNSGFSGP
jgi:hypothetical protein